MAEAKAGWALSAQALRANPERFLATVQVGITVIGTTAGAFGGSTLAIHLIPLFQAIPWARPYAEEIAVGLVVAFISYLAIVAGELVPKSLALRVPEVYARLIATPLLGLSRVASPVVKFLAGSSNLVLRIFGDHTSFTEARLSSEELQVMVEDAAKVGSLHPRASSIASRAFDFEHLLVTDVMVPRSDAAVIDGDATLEEVAERVGRTPFSRFPVVTGGRDEVIGYLAAKDLIQRRDQDGLVRVAKDLLRPVIFVPGTLKAIQLLQRLQLEHQQMAVVVDEQGSFAGLVTMEDLLEELVGEIFSEFRTEIPLHFHWEPDGSVLLPGSCPLREINRNLELDLPEAPGQSTLAGLCLNKAGYIPKSGASLELGHGLRAHILEAGPTRIRKVRLQRILGPQEVAESDSAEG